MKRKIYLSLFAVLSAFFLTLAMISYLAMADNEQYLMAGSIKQEYSLGESISIPECSLDIGGELYLMDYSLIYPDGRVSKYKNSRLDAVGNYIINYTYEKNGQVYNKDVSFEVVFNDYSQLFSCSDTVEISSNVTVNDWADFAVNGVNAKFYGYGTLKYNHVINLADSDIYSYFIEYIANVTSDGNSEIDSITFTLTDVNNENNYVTIIASNASRIGPYHYQLMTAAACDLYTPLGYSISYNAANTNGAALRSSLYGNMKGTYNTNVSRLSYVPSEKQIWMRAYPEYSPLLCLDLDNTDYIEKNDIFMGFSTDLVYLSMDVKCRSGVPLANMLISSIGGMSLSGNDNVLPSTVNFSIDTLGYEIDDLPTAVVGKGYPVFDFVAYDDYGREINDVNVIVCYGSEDGQSVAIKDKSFVPTVAGDYYIKFEAKTSNLYEYKTIKITATNSESKIEYLFNPLQKSEVVCGERVYVYEGEVLEYLGGFTTSTKVLFNGEEVELKRSAKGIYFVAKNVGNYELICSIYDWTNVATEFIFNISCIGEGAPLLEKPYISLVNILGQKVTLPRVNAISNIDGKLTYVPVKVYFDDTEITTTMSYTPSVAGQHTVRYVASNPNDSTMVTEHSFNIQVNGLVTQRRVDGNAVADYAVGPNGETAVANDYIDSFLYLDGFENHYIKDEENVANSSYQLWTKDGVDIAEMMFARPVSVDYLNISFATLKSYGNFGAYVITFTDSLNASEQVEITIKKTEVEGKVITAVFLGEQYCSALDVDFAGDNETMQFQIMYDKDRFAIVESAGGVSIADLHTYVNGDVFNGFTSGKAFISLKCVEVKGQTRVKISQISSQLLMGRYVDRIAPSIKVSDDFRLSESIYLGDNFVVKSVNAFDVCSDAKVNVKISSSTGEVIYNKEFVEGDTILFSALGKYKIEYKAVDASNNSSEIILYVNVIDFSVPSISVNSNISSASVGEDVTLPSAEIDDKNSLYVYVILPDGGSDTVYVNKAGKYNYKFNYKGKYFVRYVVTDPSMNYIVYEMEVNVE